MAKFYGEIGYGISKEKQDQPGVWVDKVVVKPYRGDVLRVQSKNQETENLNDDISLENQISIVADPFAYENFQFIKFIKWMGAAWKVKSVDASQRPRLILTVGGVYNGRTS